MSAPVSDAVLATLREEFSDLPDAAGITRITVGLLVAVALAGLLGWERERRDASAGLRTHMLVGLGSALFVLVPHQAGMAIEDLSRVLQGVIAGIGFLGAGAILKLDDKERIHGLTTAASIWTTAAIGVAAGMGRESTAILSTLLALAILRLLLQVERRVDRRRDEVH
jgi:putative Mg2+ transporter-C (MgtC) family protein